VIGHRFIHGDQANGLGVSGDVKQDVEQDVKPGVWLNVERNVKRAPRD
jgi:hypothetical protein